MTSTGTALTIKFNMEAKKTPLPSTELVVLGRLSNTKFGIVKTAENKIRKYTTRIDNLLLQELVTRKDLEKIHGCLNYVTAVEPFGRPCLAPITRALCGKPYGAKFPLPGVARNSLLL